MPPRLRTKHHGRHRDVDHRHPVMPGPARQLEHRRTFGRHSPPRTPAVSARARTARWLFLWVIRVCSAAICQKKKPSFKETKYSKENKKRKEIQQGIPAHDLRQRRFFRCASVRNKKPRISSVKDTRPWITWWQKKKKKAGGISSICPNVHDPSSWSGPAKFLD